MNNNLNFENKKQKNIMKTTKINCQNKREINLEIYLMMKKI